MRVAVAVLRGTRGDIEPALRAALRAVEAVEADVGPTVLRMVTHAEHDVCAACEPVRALSPAHATHDPVLQWLVARICEENGSTRWQAVWLSSAAISPRTALSDDQWRLRCVKSTNHTCARRNPCVADVVVPHIAVHIARTSTGTSSPEPAVHRRPPSFFPTSLRWYGSHAAASMGRWSETVTIAALPLQEAVHCAEAVGAPCVVLAPYRPVCADPKQRRLLCRRVTRAASLCFPGRDAAAAAPQAALEVRAPASTPHSPGPITYTLPSPQEWLAPAADDARFGEWRMTRCVNPLLVHSLRARAALTLAHTVALPLPKAWVCPLSPNGSLRGGAETGPPCSTAPPPP